jgi:tetratricopeptide (TPR) repeat protein
MIGIALLLLIGQQPAPQDEVIRLVKEGRYEQARPLITRLITESGDTGIGYRTALLQWLGTVENHLGHHSEAQRSIEEGLRLLEKHQGEPEVRISLLASLAEAHTSQGHFSEAGQALRRAIEVGEKELPPDHPRLASVYDALALLHLAQGQQSRAAAATKRALAILEKRFGPDHPNVAVEASTLASLQIAMGQLSRGLPLMERSYRILLAAYGSHHSDTVRAAYSLATAQLSSAPAVAEQLLRSSLRSWLETQPELHVNTVGFLAALAEARYRQGDVGEAIILNGRALELLRKVWGPEHVQTVGLMDGQARLLKAAKRGKESAALKKEADRIRERHGYAEPGRHTIDISALRGR